MTRYEGERFRDRGILRSSSQPELDLMSVIIRKIRLLLSNIHSVAIFCFAFADHEAKQKAERSRTAKLLLIVTR